MPIVINTLEQSCVSRITHSSIPAWLQQSLTRFMSNNKDRVCSNVQPEDTHTSGNSLSNTLPPKEKYSAVTVSASMPVSRLAYQKMLKNILVIRAKSEMFSRGRQCDCPDLIMMIAQCNLIGSSPIENLGLHDHDRTTKPLNTTDKSLIYASQQSETHFQESNDPSEYNVQLGSFIGTGLPQVIDPQHSSKSLDVLTANPCRDQDAFRKKKYRHTDSFHYLRSNMNHAENHSLYSALNTFCATLAARLNDLNIRFQKYIESVGYLWLQFILLLEHTSIRGGNIIYLISRTTMRRVKFHYEKPPITATV